MLEGTLAGDASAVIEQLVWADGGAMTGAGRTIFPRSSTAQFTPGDGGSGLLGPKRLLDLRGNFNLQSGALYIDASAHINNRKGAHLFINPRSPTGQPAGMLQRENGKPITVSRHGQLVAPRLPVGTAGKPRHPRP